MQGVKKGNKGGGECLPLPETVVNAMQKKLSSNVWILKKVYFCGVDKGSVFIVKSSTSAVLMVSRNSPIYSGFFLRSKAVSKKIFS